VTGARSVPSQLTSTQAYWSLSVNSVPTGPAGPVP
jgi:hypothetical protein